MRLTIAAAFLIVLAHAAVADEPAPLSTFRDCANCPEMVVMPTGSFVMGVSSKKEKAVAEKGYEQRGSIKVDIGYSFAIGKYELTVGEFGAFVDETGYDAGGPCQLRLPNFGPDKNRFIGEILDNPDNRLADGFVWVKEGNFRQPGQVVTDRHPAVCIDRDDIEAYLAWLGKKTGRKYRFPSNAEWEYATRAGTTTVWFWGDKGGDGCAYANFADRKSVYWARMMAPCADKVCSEGPAPVGSYQPNPWGLYDTVGNVLDLVADCNTDTYDGAPTDGSPHMSDGNSSPPANGEAECAAAQGNFFGRGFQFDGPVETLASFAATFAARKDRANMLSFRVAVSLDGPAWDRR